MRRAIGIIPAILAPVLVAAGAETGRVVSPAAELEAALERARAKGWRRIEIEPAVAFTPTEADRARGYAVFQRNVNARLYPSSVPGSDERVAAVTAFGARGETVAVQIGLRTVGPLTGVRVAASALRGPADANVSVDRIRCRRIEYAPVRMRRRCRVVPLRIRSQAPLALPAGWTQGYWLTIAIPADAAPGAYGGAVTVTADGKAPVRLPLKVTVLPITLTDVRDMFFGAFLHLTGPPNGPDVHSVAQLKDLADRNIHGILWFWGHYGLDVRKVGDRLRLDFTLLDTYMDRVRRAGLKGPVVLALGNDSRGHLEQAIAEQWGLPLRRHTDRPETAAPRVFAVATLDCPELDRLYIEAIRQLLDHARAKKWPELVLLPYDEPTERLEKEYAHRAALIKKHFPRTRVYGVVMGDVDGLAWLGPVSDVLVTNGRSEAVRAYARKHGKGFWTYGGRVSADQSFGRARLSYGLRPWRMRSEGHWFWAYNWRVNDPMDEFDGQRGDARWVVAYPPERRGAACMPSPAFEGMRAGVDDVRYVQALEALLARMPGNAAQPYRKRLAALRDRKADRRRGPEAAFASAPAMPFPTGPASAFDGFRLAVIRMILDAREALRASSAPGKTARPDGP